MAFLLQELQFENQSGWPLALSTAHYVTGHDLA
jgi:hypothetical protein